MSVEEARAGVEGNLYSRLEFDLPPSEDDRIAIDRLILEVQAGMPCYRGDGHLPLLVRMTCTELYEECGECYPRLCPSCQAQVELKGAAASLPARPEDEEQPHPSIDAAMDLTGVV